MAVLRMQEWGGGNGGAMEVDAGAQLTTDKLAPAILVTQ